MFSILLMHKENQMLIIVLKMDYFHIINNKGN